MPPPGDKAATRPILDVPEEIEVYLRGLTESELLALLDSAPPRVTAYDPENQDVADWLTAILTDQWPTHQEVARRELARRGWPSVALG